MAKSSTIPYNVQKVSALLTEMSEEMCCIAAEDDEDRKGPEIDAIRWHAKPLGVLAICVSAEKMMESDRSKDFEQTMNEVDRRVDETRALGWSSPASLTRYREWLEPLSPFPVPPFGPTELAGLASSANTVGEAASLVVRSLASAPFSLMGDQTTKSNR